MTTAERLFSLVDNMGMDQKAFAAAIGAPESSVSNWRVGRTASYKKYLPQIAEVLGTTVDFLLTGNTEADIKKEPTTVSDDRLQEMVRLLKSLPPEKQLEVMQYARFVRDSKDNS